MPIDPFVVKFMPTYTTRCVIVSQVCVVRFDSFLLGLQFRLFNSMLDARLDAGSCRGTFFFTSKGRGKAASLLTNAQVQTLQLLLVMLQEKL